MEATKIFALLCILHFCIGYKAYGQEKVKAPSKVSAGILTGYNRGFGIQANFTLNRSASELPFDLRAGVGYTFLNPGNSADAGRIFINNATNGTPGK